MAEEQKTKYLRTLESLRYHYNNREMVSKVGILYYNVCLLYEAVLAVQVFEKLFEEQKVCLDIFRDKDVDYEKWASDDEWKSNGNMNVLIDENEVKGRSMTVFIEDKLGDWGLKEKMPELRKLLDSEKNERDIRNEVCSLVNETIGKLRGVLTSISEYDPTKAKDWANQCKDMMDRLYDKYKLHPIVKEMYKTYKEEIADNYGEKIDDDRVYLWSPMKVVFKSGFLKHRKTKQVILDKKECKLEIKDIEELNGCENDYVKLRGLLDYAGKKGKERYSINYKCVANYLYKHREISEEEITSFIGLWNVIKNVYPQEKINVQEPTGENIEKIIIEDINTIIDRLTSKSIFIGSFNKELMKKWFALMLDRKSKYMEMQIGYENVVVSEELISILWKKINGKGERVEHVSVAGLGMCLGVLCNLGLLNLDKKKNNLKELGVNEVDIKNLWTNISYGKGRVKNKFSKYEKEDWSDRIYEYMKFCMKKVYPSVVGWIE